MPNRRDGYLPRVASGAAAGLVGTLALKGLQSASSKWLPDTMPPMSQHPGEYMIEHGARAVSKVLPRRARAALTGKPRRASAEAIALGYGMTFGIAYAALRPHSKSLIGDGIALGLLTWAAGYLGWLPATGLTPPVWRHPLKRSIAPVVRHALFGIATVGVYDLAHHLLSRATGRSDGD